MHRIDTPGAVDELFSDGNLLGVPPVEGTVCDADFLNAVQEEIAFVIEQQSISLSKGTNTQLRSAIDLRIEGLIENFVGKSRTFLAPYDVSILQGVLVGDLMGVSLSVATAGNPALVVYRGTATLPKRTGEGTIGAGEAVYWDDAPGERLLTNTKAGNHLAGWSTQVAASGDPTMQVQLLGHALPTF